MNSQFKKGFLKLAVLHYLSKTDHYGYEIVKDLGEYFDTPNSTIYPLLYKLLEEGLLDTYLVDEDSQGGIRKYYKINQQGRIELTKLQKEWDFFQQKIKEFFSAE